MSEKINEYRDYTAQELREALYRIDEGDAGQLHNALLVACDLLIGMEARLKRLEAQGVTGEGQVERINS